MDLDLPKRLYLWESSDAPILYEDSSYFKANADNPGVALAVPTEEERDYQLGLQYITGERFNVIVCPDHTKLHLSDWQAVFFINDPRYHSDGTI